MNAIIEKTNEVNVHENLDMLAEAKKQYAELKLIFDAANAPLIELIEMLETEIKKDVLEIGSTVSGEKLTAVWTSGRMSWDSKKLNELSENCPEINNCRKYGNPSVSFRSK